MERKRLDVDPETELAADSDENPETEAPIELVAENLAEEEPAAEAEAAEVVAELLHDDYAYVFEAYWDLWTPPEGAEKWVLEPSLVRLIAQGLEFEEHAAEETGHIQMDFGLDTPFLHEEIEFTSEAERNVRSNVQKLVEFTAKVEKNAGATGRLLWSESEENLAQKLIARLQRVQ